MVAYNLEKVDSSWQPVDLGQTGWQKGCLAIHKPHKKWFTWPAKHRVTEKHAYPYVKGLVMFVLHNWFVLLFIFVYISSLVVFLHFLTVTFVIWKLVLYSIATPLPCSRQDLNNDDCLKVWEGCKITRTVLCCVQWCVHVSSS